MMKPTKTRDQQHKAQAQALPVSDGQTAPVIPGNVIPAVDAARNNNLKIKRVDNQT